MRILAVVISIPFIAIGFVFAWIQSAFYTGMYLYKRTGF